MLSEEIPGPLAYRNQQGRPLTKEELNSNFKNLEMRLRALETSPLRTEGIAQVSLEGNQLVLVGTQGTRFGPLTLPSPSWEPRGRRKADCFYQTRDVVQYGGQLLLCRHPHTSAAPFDPSPWKEILSWEAPPLPVEGPPPPPAEAVPLTLPLYTQTMLPTLAPWEFGKLVFIVDSGPGYWNETRWAPLVLTQSQPVQEI